ncbi:cation-transporting atpase 4 protein [Rutstroemia sp. NJR-2017a BVV2]|nr:cation-transporting atpase 4 protein [Rutstroemia sp. NJR-2017a BVV2]
MALVERALTIVIVNFIFLGISTIFFALRCWVRVSRNAFGLDDWLLALGWVMFVINVAFSTVAATHGLGVHNLTITVAEMGPAVKYFTLFQIFTLTGTLPVKASVCVSLLRITPNPLYKKILYAIIAGSIATILTSDISVFATCRPMAYTWDKTIEGGKCSTVQAILVLSYVFSAMNIITDWSTAILPAFIVWDLKLSPRIKTAITFLLGMGILASIATIVRMKYFPEYKATVDYLYGVAPIVWWSTIEIGLGISAASLSALRPLLRFVFGSSNALSGPSEGVSPPDPQTSRGKGYLRARAIKLRDIKDGLATTMVTGAANESKESLGDKASQRRILAAVGEESAERERTSKDAGIRVTQSYKVEGGGVERRTEDMV